MRLIWITLLLMILNSCSIDESKNNESNNSILTSDFNSISKLHQFSSKDKTSKEINNLDSFINLFETTTFPIVINSNFCENFVGDSLKRLRQLEILKLPEIGDVYNENALYAFKKTTRNKGKEIIAIVVSKISPEEYGSDNRTDISVFMIVINEKGEIIICKKIFNRYSEFDYFEQSWGKINSDLVIEKTIIKSNNDKKIYKDTIEIINMP